MGKKTHLRWDIIPQDNPILDVFLQFFFGFENNLNFGSLSNASKRMGSPTVYRKHNVYYYVINHLKNICIAVAQHRGEIIKRHKLWNASFNNLIEDFVCLKLDRHLDVCGKQCGLKILFLKEMSVHVALVAGKRKS